jgi:hypothetical protein
MDLSKESVEYCKGLMGDGGCGSDYDFCKICRSNPIITKESLNEWTKKINEYVRKISTQ